MAKTPHKAYQKAKQKIETALRTGSKDLDLSCDGREGAQLVDLPESLAQLTQLKSLNVSNNQLTTLPKWLGRLSRLESIVLHGNQLIGLPEALGQLIRLQSLDVSSNRLTVLPEGLGQLIRLQSLDVSNNVLTLLPEALGQLVRLQSLDVSNNQLTELPNELMLVTRLRSLKLGHNQLTTLPEVFSRLSQLEYLSLYGNKLTALPESLGMLRQLKELLLSDNRLTVLPECIGQLKQLTSLFLSGNRLTALPPSLGQLTQLEDLRVTGNRLDTLPVEMRHLRKLSMLELHSNRLLELPDVIRELSELEWLFFPDNGIAEIPEWIGDLQHLRTLNLSGNDLTHLPDSLGRLSNLQILRVGFTPARRGNPLGHLPDFIGQLRLLRELDAFGCQLTDLPGSLAQLEHLAELALDDNPLNPELAAAYAEGLDAVKRYLRAKSEAQVVLNEAKLILIGEGEVGKSCLLGALRDDPWEEARPTTHGIEIKPVQVIDPDSGVEITLNGWDFGGQRVYRPTHQLFFSAPAVYLVVWKPREGPQQGFVRDWIKLVKHREPDAKILVVATHGGPKERQPDIDRQEIWDLFGRDMVLDFFLVDSKPDEKTHERPGISDLTDAVARAAAGLPEVGRTVPQRWQEARKSLKETGAAYLSLEEVLALCRERKMDDEEARDFVRVSHRLGHLIHYGNDPLLRDIVVLKPDWLATAISFVFDDQNTRHNRGLVTARRLGQLWNHRTRAAEFRYPLNLHPVFLRLMERFDLSYRVPGSPLGGASDETSLIAQLVPDIRPVDLILSWPVGASLGDEEQSQICRITEANSGQSAAAEGLFFQLIVRLHKYSLGRANYAESIHWQRGLVLEDDYGARALLEHAGNDVRITVRSPYPEQFLAALTYEVKWLVENFWAGLRCDVMVPCLNPAACIGLFEVRKLIENKKRKRPEQPCPVCNEWQNIEELLHNAPAARPNPLEELLANSVDAMRVLTEVRVQLRGQQAEVMGRFDTLDASSKELVSKVEAGYTGLMRTLVDEAKEGPRLFTFEPVEPGFFDRPKWISEKFRVTLWCEHSRLPLPALYGTDDKRGIYDLTLPRDWVVKAAPFLKLLAGTLSLVVPVASSATKFVLDEASYKGIEKQLDLGHKSLDSVLKGGEKAGSWLGRGDVPDLEQSQSLRAEGAVLRQIHAWLKEKDPSFGGLVRVQNKRQEFLWVHPQFEKEY